MLSAYEDAIAVPKPVGSAARVAVAVGVKAADMHPHAPARRLPSLEPKPVGKRRPLVTAARRIGFAVVTLGLLLLVWKALSKIGIANIVSALATSSPAFVILGLGIMCSAMVMRGFSWLAILRAALPKTAVRVSDAMQATFIGVLMNSTLPARLGEPSRAVVLARRTGRPRENIPIVLGTVVSQTLLNIVALIVLGTVMFSSVDLFSGHQNTLLIAAIAPAALLALVLLAPLVLRGAAGSRSRRVQVAMQSARAAMVRVRAGLVVFRNPKLGPLATLAQLERLGAAVALLLRAAGGARPLAPGWTRPPRRRSCSRSTSPPRCRPPRRTSVSSRPPVPPCCTPAGMSAFPPASPTA